MSDDSEQAQTVRPKFWSFTIGNVFSAVVVAVSVVYGAAAFATKSTSDAELDKSVATALAKRIELVDAKSNSLDARMVGVETGIVYIRESLARIERAVSPKQ